MSAAPFPSDMASLRAWFDRDAVSRLPGVLGIEIVDLEPGRCVLRCEIAERHLASNGYLHAASVVALADTASGYGSVASFPEGATGFTTIELKSNHLATALEGVIVAEASLVHGGRRTQVWDATVTSEESGRTLALFRCTQLLLY